MKVLGRRPGSRKSKEIRAKSGPLRERWQAGPLGPLCPPLRPALLGLTRPRRSPLGATGGSRLCTPWNDKELLGITIDY